MNTYTVKKGDTLKGISRLKYGNESEYMRIFNANPHLKSGNPDLIYVGEVLFIPRIETDTIKDDKINQTIIKNNDINLFIDGESVPIPDDFELERFYDTAVDRYQFNFPYTPDNEKYINMFDPDVKELKKVQIYFGNELVFTGKQEILKFQANPNKIQVTSTGRSLTYLLVKSKIPPSAYPLEKTRLNLEQVCTEWFLPLFGLKLINNVSDVGPGFEKINANVNNSPWDIISDLASQRSVVVSNTVEGNLLFQTPDLKNVVASFELGKTAGLETMVIIYDKTKRFGVWIGQAQSPGDDNLTAEFKDPEIDEQSYNVITLKDVTAGNIQVALEFQVKKSKRDAFAFPVNLPEWINPENNELWLPGQIINVKAPQVRIINGKKLLIRSVLYKKAGRRKFVTMSMIPPEAYENN